MKARTTNIRSTPSGSVFTPVSPFANVIPQLKAKVGKRLVRQFGRIVPGSLIGRALDEAVEAASATGFPHLFFPVLAEEKVRLVSHAVSQEALDHHSTLSHAA